MVDVRSGGLQSVAIVDGVLHLVLNNDIAAVEEGQREMAAFLAGRAIAPLAHNRIEVLFEELVANIVQHGFASGSDQSIHVRVARRPGAVEMIFEDDGMPFNPLEKEPPAPFSSIEAAPVGGLGISLVVKMAAGLRYERPVPERGKTFQPSNRLSVSVAG